jgi:hypothetical protein
MFKANLVLFWIYEENKYFRLSLKIILKYFDIQFKINNIKKKKKNQSNYMFLRHIFQIWII